MTWKYAKAVCLREGSLEAEVFQAFLFGVRPK